ncbi:MAG: hypothetical protein KAT09_02385 [Candidatus Aegiribacteria sp.]|nr:hypothetical protein [Candidatus Aegiribacteria sp.]
MRKLRKILKICLVFSILIWTLGFLLGKGVSLAWDLAGMAAYLAPISGVVLIIMLATGLGASPEDIRLKAGETLKCVECGRPSIPGSRYCRYHLDIMKEEEEREPR